MRNLLGFLSGLIFGLGLIVSGMANPAKVLNFLDLAGHWDPSLGFVMGGAVVVIAVRRRLPTEIRGGGGWHRRNRRSDWGLGKSARYSIAPRQRRPPF